MKSSLSKRRLIAFSVLLLSLDSPYLQAANFELEEPAFKRASETLLSNLSSLQQPIRGRVFDQQQKIPLKDVSIRVASKSISSKTDAQGNFQFDQISPSDTLIFQHVGMQTLRIAAKDATEVWMSAEEKNLEEVVVTALGFTRKEKSLGYAVQDIKGEDLQRVKGVDIGTTLTGRIAGLRVNNSTEFNATPSINLRGMTPLIVVDGVSYYNMSLRDIPVDNIDQITVLKGATASALYGSRGAGGALMITTKKGLDKQGVEISVNSNNLFFAGYLALPEVQTAYSAGSGGQYNSQDYVWGDKLDIGRVYQQWNPLTKQLEERELRSVGKDNFKNFLEAGVISNSSIRFAQQTNLGTVNTSISHVYNKGQYPNTLLNMTTISTTAQMKLSNRVTLDGSVNYNRRFSPNQFGAGYNDQGYIYNILVWTGPEYDLSQYKDYWLVKNEKQNWHYDAWYDNPYLSAYEKLTSRLENTLNTAYTLKVNLNDWSNVLVRTGYDFFANAQVQTNPAGINGTRGGFSTYHANGKYFSNKSQGFSTNNDLIYTAAKKLGRWNLDGLLGGSIFYRSNNAINANTVNGLTIPGFYSLRASVDPVNVTETKFATMTNSLYGKLAVDWNSSIFLEATGRNDWASTLPKENRSYFYPSVSSSVILSELITLPKQINLLKLRGSWAISKSIPGAYAVNQTFTVTANGWDGLSQASYPNSIKDYTISPTQRDSYEFGVDIDLLKKRLSANYTLLPSPT